MSPLSSFFERISSDGVSDINLFNSYVILGGGSYDSYSAETYNTGTMKELYSFKAYVRSLEQAQ